MLLASQCAAAVGLGEIEVRSALGQVLDARIPLALEPGKPVGASCFFLVHGARDDGVPALVGGRLTLERTSGAAALRIRSPAGVSELALALRVRAACPGQPDQEERQYTVLLDPPPVSQGARAAPPPTPSARALRRKPATPAPAAAPPPTAPRNVATGAFRLKLSTSDVDLAPMRGMDDRKRAQLRERLALLDEDDHVAALLSLRNSVRHLESRVAELQLKLATLPPATAAAVVARSPAPDASSEPPQKAARIPRRAVADSAPWWKEYLTAPWAWGLLVMALLAAVLMRRPPRRAAYDGDPTPSALLPAPPPARAPPPKSRRPGVGVATSGAPAAQR